MHVITGCYLGGWGKSLAAFGLKTTSPDFSTFLDKIFGDIDLLNIRQPLSIAPALQGEIASFAVSRPGAQNIVVDNRNVWILDFWAEQFPEARFLLLYNRPETATANAFLAGIAPREFSRCWLATHRQFLAFQRRNRQRTLLLCAEAVDQFPDVTTRFLQQHGLAVTPEPRNTPREDFSAEGLLAGSMLAEQTEVRLLLDELEASALPLGDAECSLLPTVEELFSRYRENTARRQETLGQLKKLEELHDRSRQENHLLALQLNQVQEEMETTLKSCQKLRDENVHLEVERNALTKSKHEQTKLANERYIVIQRLTKDLDEQTKLADASHADIQKLIQERDEFSRLAAECRSKLEKERQNCQRLNASCKEATQESETLLIQLNQVQQELESVFLQKQQLELAQKNLETIPLCPATTIPLDKPAKKKGFLKKFVKQEKDLSEKELREHVDLLRESGLFDGPWYLHQNVDVAQSGIDPIKHYLRHGAAEGRNPSPDFDSRYYLATNPDVVASGMNPLVHYVLYGKNEGRKTTCSPLL